VVGSIAGMLLGNRKIAARGELSVSTRTKSQPYYDQQNNLLHSWR